MHLPVTEQPIFDRPEPTWEVAEIFPAQGQWSEQEYFDLKGNRLIEYSGGVVEVLAMPTMQHQRLVAYLFMALNACITARQLGTALFSPFRIKLWEAKYREPDVMFMHADHEARMHEQYWDGADLVMEVVSEDDRRRDLEIKRFEYARAGIPEYWIVDPQLERISVLTLAEDRYRVHGEYGAGQNAASSILDGFEVPVSAVLAIR